MTVGLLSFVAPPSGGVTPYMGFVSTSNRNPSTQNSSVLMSMTRKRHVARANIVNPAILIPNFWIQSNGAGEAGSGGTYTGVTASFEYLGVFYPVTFGGSSTGTIPDNSILRSDPVAGLTIPNGAAFYSRIFINSPSGFAFMNGTQVGDIDLANGEAFNYAFGSGTVPDQTLGGTVPAPDHANMFGPCGIIANTTAPSLLIPGDSIGYGARDNAQSDNSSDLGIIARALGPFFGYSSLSGGGEMLQTFTSAKAPLRISMAQFASHVIIELTVNDIILAGGATVASLQASIIAMAALFPGKKIFLSTCLPATNSGSFPAGSGQVLRVDESVRTGINDWKRTIPSGFAGVLEMADIYETNAPGSSTTVRNGGFWKLNASFDGTHPNSTNVEGYLASSANNAAFPALFHLP